ncbi:MAG: hypothetical protein ACYDH9_09475 [Limisphaerales bacterium]
MSEDRPAEGVVSRVELAELAALFDRFEFAFDPRAIAAREAESEFENKVRVLFDDRIAPGYPHISFVAFHCHLKSLCRAYLRKNVP